MQQKSCVGRCPGSADAEGYPACLGIGANAIGTRSDGGAGKIAFCNRQTRYRLSQDFRYVPVHHSENCAL